MVRQTELGAFTAVFQRPGEQHASGAPVSGTIETMDVTVLLFASIAEAAGARRVAVPFEPGDTVASVRDRLVASHPKLARFLPTLLYALDEEYVKEDEPVAAGSTLALIPPVSGG